MGNKRSAGVGTNGEVRENYQLLTAQFHAVAVDALDSSAVTLARTAFIRMLLSMVLSS
jgi:hypothetical protein